MDHFGEQRGEGGVEEDAAETPHQEELKDLGYQPGKKTATAQTVHISPSMPHTAPPQDAATGAASAG